MNPDRLLAHFGQLADAPDAIPHLRRFILELAVRGKLVEQDPKDEPASELLKRVWADRMRPRDQENARRHERDASLFSIPPTWQWVELGEIATIIMGQSPPGHSYNKTGEGIPLINGPVEFTEGPFGKTIANQYTTEPTNLCEKGDLLLCVRGSTTGRTNVAAFQACIGRGVAAIRSSIVGPYVRLCIWRLRTSIIAMGRGIAFPSINRQQIQALPISLPPLAEQHRIVARVDELVALCDRLEAARSKRESHRDRLVAASLHRLSQPAGECGADAFRANARFYLNHLPRLTTRPPHINQLRQTILNLAVRGRLVPRDPDDEPASKLLKRLRAALKAGVSAEGLRGRSPIHAIQREELWFEIPTAWELATFDDLFVIVSGVTKGQRIAAHEAVDAPYLRVANVQRGHLDLAVMKSITVRRSDLERYALRHGDILMTEGGDWDKLGRAAIWRDEIAGCIHQNHVFRVRPPSHDVLPEWVITYANSLLGRAFFENASKQTTNLASINLTQLRSCPIPLPPLAEQHRIVAKVNELMTLCDRLEASLAVTKADSRRLLEAMLHEALAPAADHPLEAVA